MAEASWLFSTSATETLFGLATLVLLLGLILAGIAVVRVGRWDGWHRFTPLACGVFIAVVVLPSFALPSYASNYGNRHLGRVLVAVGRRATRGDHLMMRPTRLWLPAHALAIGFSLAHLMLDFGLGVILGPVPAAITAEQALILMIVLVIAAGLYAFWASALVVAGQGSKRAMAATVVLCAVGALGNGGSIVACPPPCGGAAPIGDVTHVGSLVFGIWAIFESLRALVRSSTPRQPVVSPRPATTAAHDR